MPATRKKERNQSKSGHKIQANKVDSKCCPRSPCANIAPTRRSHARRRCQSKIPNQTKSLPRHLIEKKTTNRHNSNHTKQQCHSFLTPLILPFAAKSKGELHGNHICQAGKPNLHYSLLAVSISSSTIRTKHQSLKAASKAISEGEKSTFLTN